MSDRTEELREAVLRAATEGRPLELRGGGTKAFLGRAPSGEPLSLAGHAGVVNHEPRELVLTARAGTPLAEIEALAADAGQMLPFEPPRFGEATTLGGTIACGLSGSRRPWAGSARDFVLGVKMINGRGEVLHFGGEVMKNVAGYDVSRLMCGAFGTLGLLLEISLKVLPLPEEELTLVQVCEAETALRTMNELSARPAPLSAACFDGLYLHLRLSGAPTAVSAWRKRLGGEVLEPGHRFWRDLDEQRHPFFTGDRPLWRLSVPSTAPWRELPGKQLIDWGGARRWLVSDADAGQVRRAAEALGGTAWLFRGADRGQPFHPLPEGLMALHRRLKQAFDPKGVFNPGRMYPEL